MNKYSNAMLYYKKALYLKPGSGSILNSIGLTCHKVGEYGEAVRFFNKAINSQNLDPKVYYNLANTQNALGNTSEAIKNYKYALANNINSAPVHNNLGFAYNSAFKKKNAKKSYKNAIKVDSSYASSYWNLYSFSKNNKQAINILKKCLEADNSHIKAKLTLCILNYLNGDKTTYENVVQIKHIVDKVYKCPGIFIINREPFHLHHYIYYFNNTHVNLDISCFVSNLFE
jgi:tetratricopeptide (TPR) repeat protein